MRTYRFGLIAISLVLILFAVNILPGQGLITSGDWRDINPTHYSENVRGPLRSVYVRNGGSGSIGAGDGWAVGGNSTNAASAPLVARYDGFSWVMQTFPSGLYNSVNFCTNPGAPGVGLCSANGDGIRWVVRWHRFWFHDRVSLFIMTV